MTHLLVPVCLQCVVRCPYFQQLLESAGFLQVPVLEQFLEGELDAPLSQLLVLLLGDDHDDDDRDDDHDDDCDDHDDVRDDHDDVRDVQGDLRDDDLHVCDLLALVALLVETQICRRIRVVHKILPRRSL